MPSVAAISIYVDDLKAPVGDPAVNVVGCSNLTVRVTRLVAVVVALGSSGTTAGAQSSTLDSLGWMAGCWERVTATRVVEEQWMAPRGSVMLGNSRTTQGGRTIAYEQMRLTAANGKVIFTAQPSGQPAADFEGTTVSGSLLCYRTRSMTSRSESSTAATEPTGSTRESKER